MISDRKAWRDRFSSKERCNAGASRISNRKFCYVSIKIGKTPLEIHEGQPTVETNRDIFLQQCSAPFSGFVTLNVTSNASQIRFKDGQKCSTEMLFYSEFGTTKLQ